MTTKTLKEADRYLANTGFTCMPLLDLGNNTFQASYEWKGQENYEHTERKKMILIKLHDYGDGHWSFTLLASTKDAVDKLRKTEEALSQLTGFEPHRV